MAKLKWATARLPEPYYLTFPSFGINRAFGGQGLRSGRITLYWGVKASGKSTTALQQIAQAQRDGKTCCWVDAERTFDEAWAEKNGVNCDELKYIRANGAEQILDLLLPELEKGLIDVVVIDSLQSINFEMFFDPDKNPMGSYARSSKMLIHKILNALGTQQHIIVLSHAAMDLSGQHPQLKAATGNAVDHWVSNIVKFQKLNGKDFTKDDGLTFKTRWKIEKSKQSPYPIIGEYWFKSVDACIDEIAELGSYAILDGLIDQSGAWFYYNKGQEDEQKWHGADAFYDQLRYDLTLREDVTSRLYALGVSVEDEDAEDDDE